MTNKYNAREKKKRRLAKAERKKELVKQTIANHAKSREGRN
ncbi:MAG: hypothetical protein U0103_20915 [Candidatus Obscuribacterales bacterium]